MMISRRCCFRWFSTTSTTNNNNNTTTLLKPRREGSVPESPAVVAAREERKHATRQAQLDLASAAIPSFLSTLDQHGCGKELRRDESTILQVNIGKICNLICRHCHVESGPTKTRENMDAITVNRVIELMHNSSSVTTVDITGGAPELNPHFKRLCLEARKSGREVIDRCNLTILEEENMQGTAEFLADNRIQIVASLPCYTQSNVDKQRGKGVFDNSIKILQRLNQLGYGSDKGPQLHLVYNPGGAFLPGNQQQLQIDYKKQLKENFGIVFNNLFTITNMPIKRFADDLIADGSYQTYMDVLLKAFNPATLSGLMCKNTVNVQWDGTIYDCDFNAALLLNAGAAEKLAKSRSDMLSIWDIDNFNELKDHRIQTAKHCYGCTAGAGSSCGGALA